MQIQLKRVVVTGIGMVSPIGLSANESWEELLKGKSGIIKIEEYLQRLNQTEPQNKLLNIQNWPQNVYIAPVKSGFDNQKKYKVPLCTNNANSYIMSACEEALKDSKLIQLIQEDEDLQNESGINIGIMSSNTTKLTEIIKETEKKGFEGLNRLTILHILTNMATANLSIKYKLKGPSQSASTACATGASSIGDSYRTIQYGEAKIMLAGGSEECINPTSMWASIKIQAMNQKIYEDPIFSSRPFDQDRSGFILGEGAGILVLEEMEHALKRKANIYAEIIGYGQSSDGYHLTRPLENGRGGLRSMIKAINQGRIKPEDIQCINCHATSTQVGDLAEAIAIKELFQNNNQNKCHITANKGNIGHTFGAAGSIETIFSIQSLYNDTIPSIQNLNKECCDGLFFVKNNFHKESINYLLKNSFGFGGVNVSLLFKKFNL